MASPGAPDLGFRHWIGFKGYLVINLFFVISGFLITTLILEERDATGTVSLRGFYFRRTIRIFPPYYVWLAVAVAFYALGWAFSTPTEILTCLLVHAELLRSPDRRARPRVVPRRRGAVLPRVGPGPRRPRQEAGLRPLHATTTLIPITSERASTRGSRGRRRVARRGSPGATTA